MKLANFETAKALQELGYDGDHAYFYSADGRLNNIIDCLVLHEPIPKEHFPAPRLDDAAYWLRERHNLSIRLNHSAAFGWFGDILDLGDGAYRDCDLRPTYDEALETAVTKALEIIKA